MAVTSNPLIAAAASVPFPNPKRTFVQSRYSKLDTKDVVIAENKIELADLLQEITTELKAIYRSKFIFGDYLKYVDNNYSGDGVVEFNVASPPPFEPGYINGKKTIEDDKQAGTADPGDSAKEKLRTAEELIKKLYKRNSLLEVENKYLKSETSSAKREARSGEKPNHPPDNEIGQIPNHPLFSAKMSRRCKSAPPTRLLLGSATSAYEKPAGKPKEAIEEAPEVTGVASMKQRILALTEALVACQHENHRLSQEKKEKISLRDSVLKRYLLDRDSAIGQLHSLLNEVQEKLNNPLRLTRVKQPGANINPVVAGSNMLKELGTKLNEQITQTTQSLLCVSEEVSKEHLLQSSLGPEATPAHLAGRRREMVRRVKQLAETLPIAKKKALLQLMVELKQVNKATVGAKETILQTYEKLKDRLNKELIKEKVESAYLRERVRSFGGAIDDDISFAPNYT
eukprot:TRINITY_DN9369_c0_g1_i1.p1 TRINITY_DN9369_c0_g1~~TRINITY_DN9369_c0_g1_i1.p1  ORF type:complete len:475 (+),score=182.61 TRINITY_DN9369_c0_g1_i1:60-1427(+)